ncbi:hypothetical protein ES702_01692 [subsurface metagenome]
MIESGTEVKGTKKEIDRDSPMREEVVYEFHYTVTAIPIPGFLEGLRALIMSAWTNLIAQFKGLEVLYWRLSETEFVWQGKGKSASIWEEAALYTIAIAAQGLLLIFGVAMVLKAIFEVIEAIPPIPPIPPIPQILRNYWAYLVVGGVVVLGLVFLWPRRKKA